PAATHVATIAASITGSTRYLDVPVPPPGTVSDAAATTPTSSTGITSGGADVMLATTQNGSPLSITAAIDLGTTGNLTLDVTGTVTQTAGLTAAGLQILGTGTVRLDTATNDVDTIAATHTGTISYTDTDDLTVATVSDAACSSPTSSTGITSGGADVKLTTTHALSPLSIAAAVDLGTTGNLTLDINGDVTQTSAG